jgi:NADPH-dependent 2,4-dienoyl-CoA reductase/sulfur reductase-like enzyme/Fe-S-cluster-containing hydrogenase component 2
MMERYDLIVIGAGPAGLSAAIEAASNGLQVVVFDENSRPGGQLFKQIHKFFGSREHKAKERGFKIGEDLLEEAEKLGVRVELNSTVMGIFQDKEVTVMQGEHVRHCKANAIVIATGASENMVPFDGWTLPGVIGAGSAQTMMNLHGIKPGNKVLMVGSGNVGLVVGYQLIQAGCRLEAIIDAAPRIGGYGVHASKLTRTGVPFYMSHTIKQAYGTDFVQGAAIIEVDNNWKQVPGSEKTLDVDAICIAVGLSPMSQLARIAGCKTVDDPLKGGIVPVCNEVGETSIQGIYAAGDVAGIEEASSAMIQGRITGSAIACAQGYLDKSEFEARRIHLEISLQQLREGMFGHKNKGRTDLTHTDEGYALSQNLLVKGYVADTEISHYPGLPAEEVMGRGLVPVVECTQNIPCNPCQDACMKGCIKVGKTITNLPMIDPSVKCTGCGMCVVSCSGQAIFLVNANYAPGYASVALPYEFSPLPAAGDEGFAFDRSGTMLGKAEVISVRKTPVMDETAVLTMKVPVEWSMKARFFKPYPEK